MIIWVASFPRSGNTFLRILLNRSHGITTSTVYEVDHVAARLGPDLVGYRQHVHNYQAMRASESVHFIKTHRPCDELVDGADKAICLVRDGRDAVVSWARQRAEEPGRTFDDELRVLLLHPERLGAGSWGTNVLSWLNSGNGLAQLRFEDLISEPQEAVLGALSSLDLDLPSPDSSVPAPSFDQLHAIDSHFFRRGTVGTHRDEMPVDLQRTFLASPDNRSALAALGYID